MTPPLHEWDSFYVIVGSSAAALTGLQFVVVALLSEMRGLGSEQEMRAFGTPTVVHFCAALLIAAICSVPGHSATTLAVSLVVVALVALAYVGRVIMHARRQTGYKPVFEDWLWHAILPAFAYAALLLAGLFASVHPARVLYVVAAAALLLVYIGIHNAWDTAVYIAARRKE